MLMATVIGMPLCALAVLCVGRIPACLTLGISIPTSGPPKGPSWICSAFGCTSIRRGGQFWGLGRGLRPLGASLPFHFNIFINFDLFTVISPL